MNDRVIIAERVRLECGEDTPRRRLIRRIMAEAEGDDDATKEALRWVQETSGFDQKEFAKSLALAMGGNR